MKYFLICFLLIVSCKPAIRDTGNPDIVVGTASNTKGGAVIRSDSKLYLIAGLHSWDSIYLGKKVKVTGTFKFINGKNYEKSDSPLLNTLQAQTLNTCYYSVKDATWQLYNPD